MSFDCRECPDYDDCLEPCQRVHDYYMQDQIKRKEFISDKTDAREMSGQDYKEALLRMMGNAGLTMLPEESRQIIIMYIANISVKMIASAKNKSERYVYKVIERFKDKDKKKGRG